MVRPGRRASDILRQVPAFDAAGWAVPRHVAGGPFAQQRRRWPRPRCGTRSRQVAEDLHRYADEQSRAAVGQAFVTSQGTQDSKGRGRSMHQEVRRHLGGKGATWDAKAEVTLRGMSRLDFSRL